MKNKFVALAAVSLMASTALFAGGGSQSKAASSNPNTFSLLVDSDRAPGPGWYAIYDVIEKETGIKVDPKIYPYQTALEQKQIMLSTGNYTDAMGGWIVGSTDIMNLSADGTFIPLEGLFATTTNIKEALDVPGVRASMTLPDGHIYSPPYIVAAPLVSFSPWINQVWLDKLNLKMPTTTDELKQVLIAFRDKIGTVNGQKVIPFSSDPVNFNLGTYAGWWGLNASTGGNGAGYVAVINGQIEFTANRPEYRSAIKFFAELFKEGLLDPEIYTHDQTTWKAKGRLGLYGVSVAYGAADFHEEIDPKVKESDPSKNWGGYVPLPVLKGPGVTTPIFRNNDNGTSLLRTQFIVTDKAAGAKAANIVKWLDALYSPAHSLEQNAGPQNVAWKILSQTAAQTIWQSIDISSQPEDFRNKNAWGGYSIPSLPRYERPTWKSQPRPGWENEYKETDVRDALYKPYLEKTPMPALWINPADVKRHADLQTAITDYIRRKEAEWVFGQANIDAEWDAYVADLDRMGLPELLAIKRKAVKL